MLQRDCFLNHCLPPLPAQKQHQQCSGRALALPRSQSKQRCINGSVPSEGVILAGPSATHALQQPSLCQHVGRGISEPALWHMEGLVMGTSSGIFPC